MDGQTETTIQQAPGPLPESRTNAAIIHRLDTIRNAASADHSGRIVEHGTHTKLSERDVFYRRFRGPVRAARDGL